MENILSIDLEDVSISDLRIPIDRINIVLDENLGKTCAEAGCELHPKGTLPYCGNE